MICQRICFLTGAILPLRLLASRCTEFMAPYRRFVPRVRAYAPRRRGCALSQRVGAALAINRKFFLKDNGPQAYALAAIPGRSEDTPEPPAEEELQLRCPRTPIPTIHETHGYLAAASVSTSANLMRDESNERADGSSSEPSSRQHESQLRSSERKSSITTRDPDRDRTHRSATPNSERSLKVGRSCGDTRRSCKYVYGGDPARMERDVRRLKLAS